MVCGTGSQCIYPSRQSKKCITGQTATPRSHLGTVPECSPEICFFPGSNSQSNTSCWFWKPSPKLGPNRITIAYQIHSNCVYPNPCNENLPAPRIFSDGLIEEQMGAESARFPKIFKNWKYCTSEKERVSRLSHQHAKFSPFVHNLAILFSSLQ